MTNSTYTPEEPYVFRLSIPRQVIPSKTMKAIKNALSITSSIVAG